MQKIAIPPNSFFEHGYMQHAGPQWQDKHSLRNHMSLNLETKALADAIHFAYVSSLAP